jgi:glycine oxidase
VTRHIEADVAVIGGGVIGLACAYELLQRGRSVVVLERDRAGSGAGAVAAGMLAPVSEVETEEPAFVDLALESCGLYPQWIQRIEADAGLGCGYRGEGSLLLALHRDHELELERLMATQRRMGLQSELITREQALEKEPYISPRVISGLFVAGDRQVNPRRLTLALAAAILARGGSIIEGEAASPLFEGDVAVGAATSEAEVRAEAVLIAAGAWSGQVWPGGSMLPVSTGGTVQPPDAGPLPMRPVKGQILRLRGPRLIDHVLRTPDVYLVPREDGELVVGATMEEQGFDTTITTWAVMDLLRDAWRMPTRHLRAGAGRDVCRPASRPARPPARHRRHVRRRAVRGDGALSPRRAVVARHGAADRRCDGGSVSAACVRPEAIAGDIDGVGGGLMRAKVNGELVEIEAQKTIAALVQEITGSPEQRGVAVARNGEIVRHDAWSEALVDGDEIDIVRAVQGG